MDEHLLKDSLHEGLQLSQIDDAYREGLIHLKVLRMEGKQHTKEYSDTLDSLCAVRKQLLKL